MNFREFIELNEFLHLSFPQPMNINGIYADSIDFRFEDWGRGYHPDKHRNLYPNIVNPQKFIHSSFSAPLANNKWLNANIGEHGKGNLGVATKIDVSSSPRHQNRLPVCWFDFAAMYFGNHLVKVPEWPRTKIESRPYAVAEIE